MATWNLSKLANSLRDSKRYKPEQINQFEKYCRETEGVIRKEGSREILLVNPATILEELFGKNGEEK